MVHSRYNLVFYGEIADGDSVEHVRQKLTAQLNLDSATREQLLAGKSVVIQENMDKMAASILQSTCERNGAICSIELARVDTAYGSIDVSKLCHIEFRGETALGQHLETVKDRLYELLKANRQTIDQLFCGKPIIIKKDVDYQTALQIQKGFEQAGAICRIIASDKSLPQDRALKYKIFLPTNLNLMICPNCGHKQNVASMCAKCGIVVQRFVKKKSKAAPGRRNALQGVLEDAEDAWEDVEEGEEEAIIEEKIGPPRIPVWQIGLVGNVIFTLLLTLFGISYSNILVTVSLNPDIYMADPAEFENIFALLFSNVQIVGLIGPLVPLMVFFHRTLYVHKDRGLHYRFWIALLILLGGMLLMDMFATLFGGSPFVGAFSLKALGLSGIAYLIGFGVFLVIKRKEMFAPVEEEEEAEFFDDEDGDAFIEEETEPVENSRENRA